MKTKITTLIALFLLSLSATAQIDRSMQPKPGPAPKITLEVPGEFQLKNGLKVLVVENHKLPRVSYTLKIDNKPHAEGKNAGTSSLLGAMLGNGTATISKDVFNEEIDFLGARLNFNAEGASASALSKYSERIMELMADAAINPLLTDEEFQKEKAKAIEGIKSNAKSVDAVASRVGGALSYGKNHPYGEFVTEETLNNITIDNIRAYYQTYFNPNNAYLVIVGDVDFYTIKKQVEKYFKKWEEEADISTTVPKPIDNVQYTQINFIDMPNAVQSNISITNNVVLKMNDPDYHAVLIANKILGGGFNSYLNMNLREANGYTYGARSNVGTDRYGASRFTAGTAVRNAVTDSAVVESLKELKRIKTTNVTYEALNNAKAKYVGDFVLALESPRTVANYALNIKTDNLPKDFYKTYLEKINAVTVADVKRVANKYFSTDNARIVVVGKGSEVINNLEKTGLTIKYFDAYANPVDKPTFSKPIPEGVTAQTVINDYITAIGGKENLNKVNSLLVEANVTIQGAPYAPKATVKSMAPNKFSMELNIEGMGTVMKQKFNGVSGYQEQAGQRAPMEASVLAEKKAQKGIFEELYLTPADMSLESIIVIEGQDTYKIKVTQGDKVSHKYYGVDSNYLVRTEGTTEAQGQTINSVEDTSNYKKVNDVMIPYTQHIVNGPQTIIFETTSVKINEGVSVEDFN
ncbi:insulinase family protein [Bizionia gelidisalsuginis]|uniref:Insulinase family protein n=2 Tax=Bizionia TaxID=283785 RepID=A0A8H2QE89_9FLAO|nr:MULTISPECIES: pitrilysin family protein [Bizionia]TYB70705.1 insulinase family protein [Bizionia saleffrena]TYC10167.1 insulinase family protein [Bizionia gelidisalsuginis]